MPATMNVLQLSEWGIINAISDFGPAMAPHSVLSIDPA
jgi:hypothetical protein